MGYNQSGHIPNADPNNLEVILWSGEQRWNTRHKETSGSGPGFGPKTFGSGKVSPGHGKVSLFEWTLESNWGIEPRTLIWTKRIRTYVGMRGVLHRPNRHVMWSHSRTWYSRPQNQYMATNEHG